MSGGVEVKIEFITGACPVQAEGVIILETVGECPFYFRYRGDRAALHIWEPGHRNEFIDRTHELAYYEQRDVTGIEHFGYMEDAEVEAFIERWAFAFAEEIQSRSSHRKNEEGT